MTRSKFLRVATLVCAAAITVTACGERKPTPAVESTTATGASVSTDTVKVQGVWSDTVTAQSGYLAEYVNGKLVVIEEQMMFPDGTRSTRAYFYNADYTPTRLFEHRALTAASSNSTPKTLHSLLNIGIGISIGVHQVLDNHTVRLPTSQSHRGGRRRAFALVWAPQAPRALRSRWVAAPGGDPSEALVHAEWPRAVRGRRGARSPGAVRASADGRGARDAPRVAGARVDGGSSQRRGWRAPHACGAA